MAQTIITGPINNVNNQPFANKWIKFTLGQVGTDGTAGVTVAQSSDSVQTDASGDFSITIWDNGESGKLSVLEIKIEGNRPEYVIIPQGTVSIELWDLIENHQVSDSTPQVPVVSELFLEKSANLSDLSDVPTSRTNLGLGNVDNTADADKPISTATQTALDGKQAQSTVLDNTTASYTVAEENKLSSIPANIGSATTSVTGTLHSATTLDKCILANNSAGVSIALLPSVVAGDGFQLTIKNVGASGSVTVDADGAETIDGGLTAILTTQYESITVVCDGSNWNII